MKKLPKKIKQYLKEYYKIIIVYIVILALFLVEFPYYISAPGGLINTENKISTEDNFKLSGTLNMAYVSEIHATIPTLIYSAINKDWDTEKEADAYAFALRYRNNIAAFRSFISDSDFSVSSSYKDSWNFIKSGMESLKRHTNLGLCFPPVPQE